MDKFEEVVSASLLSVAILGNLQTSDFTLVDLLPEPLPESLRLEYIARGFSFIGVVGISKGVPRAALAEPLTDEDMRALSEAAVQHLENMRAGSLAPKGRFRVAEQLSN
jgi:hypothetical protein